MIVGEAHPQIFFAVLSISTMSIRIVARSVSSSSNDVVRAAHYHSSISSRNLPYRGSHIWLSFRGKSSGGAGASSAPTSKAPAGVGSTTVKEAASEATSASSDSVPIGMTSIAMILAIGTVSAGAALAENATASLVPKFDPKLQRFDQSTFSGRLSKMLLACDPFLLTYSSEEVKKCKAMVDNYEHLLMNLPTGVNETEMSRRLWEAQVNDV